MNMDEQISQGPFVMPELSVVIPVYGNQDTLIELHQRIGRTLVAARLVPYEILFVHDASPDASLEILKGIVRSDPQTSVLSFQENQGQQRAVLAGLRWVLGRQIVVMDADLQDPPEAITALAAGLAEGVDVVFAGRTGAHQAPSRMLTSRLYKRVLSLWCGIPSDAGMFLAMNKSLVDRLMAIRVSTPVLLPMIGCAGSRMRSLPVERSRRMTGQSGYSPWMRLWLALQAFSLVFRLKWSHRRLSGTEGGAPREGPLRFGARWERPDG